MTAVVGLRCQDELVLYAERLISFPGSHHYYEGKLSLIDGPGWCIAFAYAGSPQAHKALRQMVQNRVGYVRAEDMTCEKVRTIVDESLQEMFRRKQNVKFDQLAVAFSSLTEGPKLFEASWPKKALLPAEDFTCLGVGESPLIRYLASKMYSRDISSELGKNVAVYLVAKAVEFIDGCGGPIDAVVIRRLGKWDWLTEQDTGELRSRIEAQEQKHLLEIVNSGAGK